MINIKKIHIIALAALGGGLSGGDRIFIEFARRWSKEIPVSLYVWEEGLAMCRRENLEGVNIKINLIRVGNLSKLGFIFTYFYRILLGIKLGLTMKLNEEDYIYSSSEFWMDSLPAFIIKIRKPNIKWVAAWYQTAPHPIKGFTEGSRENTYKGRAFLYWFIQKTTKPIISNFADFILVNNDDEKLQFSRLNKVEHVVTVLGAINTDQIMSYQKKHLAPKNKKYLAVFQGRFHPQKGVVELIEIWKLVTNKIPDAKLVMIGDGPLMGEVKEEIDKLNLNDNIELVGYLHDGDKKYSIFQSSKIVVHPAFYDSGGMAAAEAMAFGLPCVGFDLKSYSFYYPQGMIKVPIDNLEAFANKIVELNEDQSLYKRVGFAAMSMIMRGYSWEKRAAEILSETNFNK